MDDELEILEAELKRMRPAAPSRALVAQIGRELDAHGAPAQATRFRWWWAAALPLAAAVAVLMIQRLSRSDSSGVAVAGASTSRAVVDSIVASDASLKPVAAENLLVSARDEGLVTLDDGTQARRERLQFIDTITWKNPRTKASLTWSVPREEVRVVPVVFQ